MVREQTVTRIESLFVMSFQESSGHHVMTLPEYASRFLAEIEVLFGPRDPSFSLLGIDIDKTPGNQPRLWYPDTGIAAEDSERRSKHVVIRLSGTAYADPARARWQLAHECIHLLDPWNEKVDGGPTNILEEGLASWYQNTRVPEAEHHEGQYARAEALVKPWINQLAAALKRIRLERELRIGECTPQVLRDYVPELPEQTLRDLSRPFRV